MERMSPSGRGRPHGQQQSRPPGADGEEVRRPAFPLLPSPAAGPTMAMANGADHERALERVVDAAVQPLILPAPAEAAAAAATSTRSRGRATRAASAGAPPRAPALGGADETATPAHSGSKRRRQVTPAKSTNMGRRASSAGTRERPGRAPAGSGGGGGTRGRAASAAAADHGSGQDELEGDGDGGVSGGGGGGDGGAAARGRGAVNAAAGPSNEHASRHQAAEQRRRNRCVALITIAVVSCKSKTSWAAAYMPLGGFD